MFTMATKAKKKLEYSDSKTVYVVWTNTDLTEGRGNQYPLYVCECLSTANRMALKRGVQGCDADVREDTIYCINYTWYIPGVLYPPSDEDRRQEVKMQADLEARKKFDEAINKAKASGLSDEDIKNLQAFRHNT